MNIFRHEHGKAMTLYKMNRYPGLRYVIAIFIVMVATVMRIEFLQSLGMRAPFITFYPAVIIAALLGGFSAGLLATVFSALMASYFWIAPAGQLRIENTPDLLATYIFVVSCVMVSGISEAMHRAQSRAINAKVELQLAAEREQTAMKLQETQGLLNSLVEETSDAIFLKDRKGRYLLFNSAASRFVGKSREEVIGKDDTELLSAADAKMVMESDQAIMASGGVMTFEEIITDAAGVKKTFLTTKGPLLDAQGNVTGLFGIARDITERKHSEQVLRQAKDEWERTFDSVPDLIAIIDSQYRIVRANRSMAQRLGVTPEECIGQLCYHSIHRSDHPPEFCPHALTMADGREHACELHEELLGGVFMSTTTPLLDEHGQMIGAVHVVRDITERKRAEESVRKLNEELELRVHERTVQLENANKELESFSYSVSHDLIAPLRHMAGYSRLLLEDYGDKLEEGGVAYLERIMLACEKMRTLIDSLLQLSRIGRADVNIQSIDLSRLAHEIVGELMQGDPERIVQAVIAEGLVARGDLVLLRVVLANLLGNAWKYTRYSESAKIEFGAEIKNGKSIYFVRDNGVGFDMAYANKLFGAFQRLHSEGEFEGTGIGLATVQRIIRCHGGDVWAQAEKGKGAIIYFTLG